MIKFLLITAMSLMTLSSQAQESVLTEHHDDDHGGRLFAGGSVTFWRDTKEKTTTLDICPEVGYLFNDKWGVGVLLGYEHEKGSEDGKATIDNSFKISPFVRYYYYHKGPFNLFLDGGAGINFGSFEKNGAKERKSGFEVGVRPGACADLTDGLCLCLRMGFMGFRKSYFSGEEPLIGNDGFGLRFAPEELMIGLELEF